MGSSASSAYIQTDPRTYATQEDGEERNDVKSYDYVIVGGGKLRPSKMSRFWSDKLGGTAGCILASRLSEDPNVTVCVLEAGVDHSENVNVQIPCMTFSFPIETCSNLFLGGYMKSFFDPNVDWMFMSAPQLAAKNRSIYLPRYLPLPTHFILLMCQSGKGLGGSSNVKTSTAFKSRD